MSNVIKLENKKKKKEAESMDPTHEGSVDAADLEMIKRGIIGGLGMLDKAMEDSDISPEGAAMALAIQKTLKNMNDLIRLIEHDMVGTIKGLEAQAAGQWTTQAHLQILIDTLKKKDIVTDGELESTWNEVIPPMMEEMRNQS